MRTRLIREHGREYSLFRVYAWRTMMSKHIPDLLGKNMDTMAMVYRGKDLVDVYYDESYIKDVAGLVAVYARDKDKVKKFIKNFYKKFEELKPYFNKEKVPQDIAEFRRIYDLYVDFYSNIAVVFMVPTLPKADQELKKLCLKARQDTQKYNEAFEPINVSFLEINYPHLKGKTRFVLPEEVWKDDINKPGYLDRISKREKGFVFYQGRLYTGEIAKILEKLNIELSEGVDQKDIREFKGQVAQKGKASGRVRIVSSIKDLPKVKKSDILVASNTMPKYLPAMKRAAAFITDEGGITCHAAIVSREMKKPCIIGTKVATRVLKDGMRVEVDANSGIIKIIN